MGEYFNGYKLGTCDHLMYVTRPELEMFAEKIGDAYNQSKGNLLFIKDYLRLGVGYLYRFPREFDQKKRLEDIANRKPDDYLQIFVPGKFELPHKEHVQVQLISHVSCFRETFNLDFCPMNAKNWDKGFRPKWAVDRAEPPEEICNIPLNIIGNRYTEENPEGYTVFSTVCCDEWFACTQEEIDQFILPDMETRGLIWEMQHVRGKKA